MHFKKIGKFLKIKKNQSGRVGNVGSKGILDIQFPDRFKEKDKQEILISIFEDEYRIPDAWRYIINVKSNGNITLRKCTKTIHSSHYNDAIIEERQDRRERIVLVLESPHREEYSYCDKTEEIKVIGPAQGMTGKAIEQGITKLLSEIEVKQGKYDFFIVNPIPFMTSLGCFYTTGIKHSLRDSIWNKLWKLMKNDFIKRINKYKPNIIINSCTSKLKLKVTSVLTGRYELFETYHPACNWVKNKYHIKKVQTKK